MTRTASKISLYSARRQTVTSQAERRSAVALTLFAGAGRPNAERPAHGFACAFGDRAGTSARPSVHDRPFGAKIVRAHRYFSRNWGGLEGLGESAPIERYGESVESVLRISAPIRRRATIPICSTFCSRRRFRRPRAAAWISRFTISIGKDCGQPLYRLFGLDPVTHAGYVVHHRHRRSG